MHVSVYGLGYVGCVLTACLADHGHHVTGVDINPQKVRTVNDGRSPVEEAGVEPRIEAGVEAGRVTATTDAETAVANSDLSFVTVGTPLDDTGQLNTTNIYNVLDAMSGALREGEHTIVLRSTVPPQTTRNLRDYLGETLDGTASVNVVVNPEFLREGTALDDFYDPPYVVLGTFPEDDASAVRDLYASMGLDDCVTEVRPEVAEALKMANNAFHALKICYANEVGSVASAAGVDGKELLGLVCADRKLNISPKYLEPGFAFGGSCLPKDTRAIATLGETRDVETPLLSNITTSNDTHLRRVSDHVNDLACSTIGVVGLSFKSGTADMRNSPGLRLVQQLEDDVVLYAGGLDPAAAIGSNRDYLDRTFPDIESYLIGDADEFLDAADVVVFTNDGDHGTVVDGIDRQVVVDPVGAVRDRADQFAEYHSVTW